jgi:hypothetical protein
MDEIPKSTVLSLYIIHHPILNIIHRPIIKLRLLHQ